MARRIIFDHDPDPVRLFDELYFLGARDFKGLPLGDVAGHARRRYTACYGAMCLARMLTDLGRIEVASPVDVVGARFQDKQTSAEFPAAHVIPCDLTLALPTAPSVHLYQLLLNPLNRAFVQQNIFGRTDRVHRLVNIADRSCEAGVGGMAMVLAGACEQVIRVGLQAKSLAVSARAAAAPPASVWSVFETVLLPGYVAAARARLRALERDLSAYERTEMMRPHPLDQFGKAASARPADTKLGSPDPEARAAARIALHQVLRTYADPSLVDRQALMSIAGQIEALRQNERIR